MFSIEELESFYEQEKEQILKDYLTYLRFASVATDPNHKKDVIQCAHWLADFLKKGGFEIEMWTYEDRPPTLFAAQLSAGGDKETILFYGHYDVQPVDPLEEWNTPPFEPALVNGDIFARGAVDDKGQSFYMITALRILLNKAKQLPVNIKLLIEGEEESGSMALSQLLKEKQNALRADHLLIVDSAIQEKNIPSITLGARGIACFSLTLKGSHFDLHSGAHGGIAYNPNRALARILASLHDPEGRVAVPGFYDEVVEIPPSEKKELSFHFDPGRFKEQFGYLPSGMEKGFDPLEANWLRPTLEINGITGGYGGNGFKTVIPAKATAKLSVRLVPRQRPEQIIALVREYIMKQIPEGFHAEFDVMQGHGSGFRSSPHSRIAGISSKAFEQVFEKPCEKILIGGSIPIAVELADASKAEMVLIGMSLPGDRVHAPNEHFGLDRFKTGYLVIARIVELFSEIPRPD